MFDKSGSMGSEIKPEPEIKPKEIKVPERVQRQFEL